jgi:putative oxidoreductase
MHIDETMLGAGLLLVRLVLGPLMAAHGAQKLLGWFGGYGLATTAGYFEQIGFLPGRLFVLAAAGSEIGSGLLVTVGFLGPVGPAVMVSTMAVAAVSVHWKHGLFATTNGIEVSLLYAAAATGLALTGPGPFSLDSLLGLTFLWQWPFALLALSVGLVGSVANLSLRRSPR